MEFQNVDMSYPGRQHEACFTYNQSRTLCELPAEILSQILRLAYVPEKLIVAIGEHRYKAVVHYWSHVPVHNALLSSLDSEYTLIYQSFYPSSFAVNRELYSQVWHLLSSTTWHFRTIQAAWLLLCFKAETGTSVIPQSVQRFMRNISLSYRGPENHYENVVQMPSTHHILRLISYLKSSRHLRVLEVFLPWPDWEHQVQIIKVPLLETTTIDYNDISYETISLSISNSLGIRPVRHRHQRFGGDYPFTDLRTTFGVIRDLCWQGIETRCHLWGLNIGQFDRKHLAAAEERLQMMRYLKLDKSGDLPLESLINHPKADRFEGTGLAFVNSFFQVIDPEDLLWKDRSLVACIFEVLGREVGSCRVKFRVSLADIRKYCNSAADSITPVEICAGIRPQIIIG